MESFYIDRLEELCKKKKYKRIIDSILEIPDGERDYEELAPFLSLYLLHALHGTFEAEDMVKEDQGCVVIPDWKVAVTPRLGQISDKSVVLHFYLYFPEWGKEIYECSAGMGNDLRQAFRMAMDSFLFSVMDGIGAMVSQDRPYQIETQFMGKTHQFQVYLSNIIGMGNAPRTAPNLYWEALKEAIVKRLGNQVFCFVTIYGAKSEGVVTGECRIDDVKSEELSAMVAKLTESWEDAPFSSHKQFILIRQEEKTVLPYPYIGQEGQERFSQAVLKAAAMFHEADTKALYDTLKERLEKELGDRTLAQECFLFLPELCAQNAFDEIAYEETLEIVRGDRPPVVCYKSQLADYWPMWNVLASAFQEEGFGADTAIIYQEYISASSIYDVVQEAEEKGNRLSDCCLNGQVYQVSEDFEIR